MGLSSTVCEMNGDSSRKSQNFPTLVYFSALADGLIIGIGIGTRSQKKTRMMRLSDGQKRFKIGLAI